MLALGIGINTAMFGVIRGVLFEPLPFTEPDRLVRVHHGKLAGPVAGQFSPEDYEDIVAASSTLDLAAFWHAPGVSTAALTGVGDATLLLDAAYVSGEFFDMLGTRPLLGRYPGAAEPVRGSDRVAVLSEALSRSLFGDIDEI